MHDVSQHTLSTHENPTYFEEDVLHYCVANMPGAYARTATQALNNSTQRWVMLIADNGITEACNQRPELISGINCMKGKVTCKPVGEAHGIEATDPVELL